MYCSFGLVLADWCEVLFFFSSRRRHTRCALVTGVQTCALPICLPRNKESAFAYRADLRERTAAAGRDPDLLFVFGGISTIVGSTREEVQRLSAERNSYASIEGALLSLGQSFNDYDFSQHDLDAPLPAVKEEWLSRSKRSEENTSELQSLMRNSYAVICL